MTIWKYHDDVFVCSINKIADSKKWQKVIWLFWSVIDDDFEVSRWMYLFDQSTK